MDNRNVLSMDRLIIMQNMNVSPKQKKKPKENEVPFPFLLAPENILPCRNQSIFTIKSDEWKAAVKKLPVVFYVKQTVVCIDLDPISVFTVLKDELTNTKRIPFIFA